MKIWIAGEQDPALEASIKAVASERTCDPGAPVRRDPESSAMILGQAVDEADYLDRLVRLAWIQPDISTGDFDIPRRPGFCGRWMAVFKGMLWKLLRYQHDRMAFQHNRVYSQHAALFEFERAEYLNKISNLEARIERLEGASARDGADHGAS